MLLPNFLWDWSLKVWRVVSIIIKVPSPITPTTQTPCFPPPIYTWIVNAYKHYSSFTKHTCCLLILQPFLPYCCSGSSYGFPLILSGVFQGGMGWPCTMKTVKCFVPPPSVITLLQCNYLAARHRHHHHHRHLPLRIVACGWLAGWMAGSLWA